MLLENDKYKDIFIYILGRYFGLWHKIQITDIGLYSLTHISEAEVICKSIMAVWKRRLNCKVSFIDGCAGMGFDSWVLSYYGNVLANELSSEHLDCVKRNIELFRSNVKEIEFQVKPHKIVYSNLDITDFDAIGEKSSTFKDKICLYLDPPFGGKDYDKQDNLRLNIGDLSLEDFVNESFKRLMNVHLIVLKLPYNYDLTEFTHEFDLFNLAKLKFLLFWR